MPILVLNQDFPSLGTVEDDDTETETGQVVSPYVSSFYHDSTRVLFVRPSIILQR
jgi:hypothetical protein